MTNNDKETTPAENHTWQDRLNGLHPVVEEWRERTRSPLAVEKGSALDSDQEHIPLAETLIWYSICIATEHLAFLLTTLRTLQKTSPTAQLTLARTAHSVACNAVWLLAPDSQNERIKRTIIFRTYDLEQERKLVNSFKSAPENAEKIRATQLSGIDQQRQQLRDTANVLELDRSVKANFNQTQVIEWVAKHINTEDNFLTIDGHNFIWRSGSGAAHGQLHFALMQVDNNTVELDEAGRGIIRLSGDLEKQIGPAIGGTFMVLKKAFELYELRRRRT